VPTLTNIGVLLDNSGRDDVLSGGVKMIPGGYAEREIPRLDQVERQSSDDQAAASPRRTGARRTST